MGKGNVEDIFVLSPMQQGMLFHSISAKGEDSYYEQLSFTLSGPLDVDEYKKAWEAVVARHPALRAGFSWDRSDQPLQVILRSVELPWDEIDLSDLPDKKQGEALERYYRLDKQKGFDLAKPPLMRFAMLKLGEHSHRFFWSFHHILKDGWSSALVMKEAFALHEAGRRGEKLELETPRPPRDYIEWLSRQNLTEAETFWKQTLDGFDTPTRMVIEKQVEPGHEAEYSAEELSISAELTAALQETAKSAQLTLNTLVQCAWAVLLQRYAGVDDVVFGSPVTGRPVELSGVESMVGLFINTLPIRARMLPDRKILDCGNELQRQCIDIRQFEYVPLVQIQRWSDVPKEQALFESLFVFENVPLDQSLFSPGEGIEVVDIDLMQQTHFPINIFASVLDAVLGLRVTYDARRFSSRAVRGILEHLEQLLAALVDRPEATVEELGAVITPPRLDIVVAASFTVEPLIEPLGFWMRGLGAPACIRCSPYNQIFQELLDESSTLRSVDQGAGVILIRLEDWVQLEGSDVQQVITRLEKNVGDFIDLLTRYSEVSEAPTLLCVCPPSDQVGSSTELCAAVTRLEQELTARAAGISGVTVLDYGDLQRLYPVQEINDPHADAEGHIPYTEAFFAALATGVARSLFCLRWPPTEVVVLDGESMLWAESGGGDHASDGSDEAPGSQDNGVSLGPEHVAVQKLVLERIGGKRKICLCGAGEERRVTAALRRHRDAPLRMSTLASWRIDDSPLAVKLESLSEELQVPLDRFLFLSSSPDHCHEVLQSSAAVTSVCVPADVGEAQSFVANLWALDSGVMP